MEFYEVRTELEEHFFRPWLSNEGRSLTEILREDDPSITAVMFSEQRFKDQETLVQWTAALQTNTKVHSIHFSFCPPTDDEFDYTSLLDTIRTRSQLRILGLNAFTYDISSFLSAAAENAALQYLDFSTSDVFSVESIAKFCWHPNLKEIQFGIRKSEDDDDDDPNRIVMIKQVIETCPLMNSVYVHLDRNHFTINNWGPIYEAICKVKPKVTLLLTYSSFDEQATNLLQGLLQNGQMNVHLSIDLVTVKFSFDSLPPRLPQLLGSSVQVLNLKVWPIEYGHWFPINVTKELEGVMHFLKQENSKSLRELAIVNIIQGEYQAVLDGIPDILYLERITVGVHTLVTYSWANGFSSLLSRVRKKKFLEAIGKNVSIIDADLRECYENWNEVVWTDMEKKRLCWLQQRNIDIAHIDKSASLIPLSVWPHIFKAVQKTRVGSSLIYQWLQILAPDISETNEKETNESNTDDICWARQFYQWIRAVFPHPPSNTKYEQIGGAGEFF